MFAESFRIVSAIIIYYESLDPMVVYWSQRACLETLKVSIEIDQQAQSDGLCKIKAVNNDPVMFPRMDTAIKTILKTVNAVDGDPWKGCSGKVAIPKP